MNSKLLQVKVFLEAVVPKCNEMISGSRVRVGEKKKQQLGNINIRKNDNMIFTLNVFKEVHNTWPAKDGRPAGESWDLLCMDNSNPPEHRMEEMLYYRTKEDERAKVWGKSVGTTIQVGVSKIRHGENGGKATLLGCIVFEPKK